MTLQFKQRLVFLLLFFGLYPFLFAQDAPESQDISIKGKLTDDQTGEAIIGAFVYIKGTKTGGQTDVDGNFEIKTKQEPPFTLAVSYVGYQVKEIEVYEQDEAVEFKLRPTSALSEVVVVGYGEQKREDFTGSLASVPQELKSQPVSSVERLLQGAVAGVQVTQTTGQPGGGVAVRVRGGTSITAGNEPLYVIDGFPVYNDNAMSDATVANGPKINPLSTINTSDIESIDVLKDASATAIYGSRGANGVILVTTKKGRAGGSSINYDGYYGVQSVVKTLPVLNARQWGELKNDAFRDSGKQPYYTQEQLDQLGEGTNWQKEAFRQGAIQNHNLSILSGSDKTRFAISGNYFKQDGILQNTDFERYAARLNLEHEHSKRFKIGTYLTGSQTLSQIAPQAVVPALLQMPPTVSVYNADGTFTLRSPYESPLANPINSLYNQLNESKTNRILGNVYGEYKILEGLSAKVLIGVDLIDNKQNRFLPATVYEGSLVSGQAQVGTVFSLNWLNEYTLNYTKHFNENHKLDAVVGYTQQRSNTRGTVAQSAGFATDYFEYNNLGAGTTLLQPLSFSNEWVLKSYLGRVNYGFKDKYFLTLTVRADGSSRFGNNNKWGSFPSAAVAWNAGKEDFIRQFKGISLLKFRFSAGLTGNQQIPTYKSLDEITYYRYNFGNNIVSGYAPSTYANPNLTWEKTFQYDFGIDFGFLKNRVNIVFDLYYKKTSDLLLNVPVPYTSGVANVFVNQGVVENKGVEIGINSQNIQGKLRWNTNFVFSANKNKILSLGDGVDYIIADPSIAQVGSSLGSFYVYKTNGLFQAGDDFSVSPTQNTKAGSQKYLDINGDGKIDQANDRVIVGNALPKFIAGLTNTFSYKGFDLTIFLQTSYGNKIYNTNRQQLELGTGYVGASTVLLNRWTPTNTNTDVHRAIEDPAATNSDRFVEDASYLRLKNVSLGYTIPKLKKVTLRVYVSAQNWKTWTSYTGYDPEASLNEQATLNQGIDNGVYPNSKTVLGGLSLTF